MKKPIHILIIPSWYPAKAGDIGGVFFREQALALSKVGHKVGVIAPLTRSLRDWKGVFLKPYGLHYEIDEGIATYRWNRVHFTPKLNFINKANWISAGLKLFDEYVRNHGFPDIIHVHSLLNAGFVAQEISLKHNIPYVVTEHSSAFARGLVSEQSIKKLQSVAIHSKKNIAVSDEFKKLLNEKFICKNWCYIPNIVSNEFIKSSLPKKKIKVDFVFISICRLIEKKRVDILIRSFAELSKDVKGIKLKIGGDGSVKNQLIELADELGISKSVEFLGTLNREEVLKHITYSDAFVLASEYETFGVVLVEALALGKPVVATRCGGPESIVVPTVGCLVEKNSVEALTQGMRELYINKNKYCAENIRKYCYENFSEDAVVNELNEIYHTVLNEYTHDSE